MATKKTYPGRLFRVLILGILLACAVVPAPVRAFSVTLTVTTSADNTAADGQCSLGEAITNANNNAATYPDCDTGFGAEIITFAGALGTATITLSSTLPSITDPAGLTISGAGKITISGNNLFQVFIVGAVPLTLDGLTVANGFTNASGGGAYLNPGGTLTVRSSTFSNNGAGTFGGGIDSSGTLVIIGSTFLSNSAAASGGGVMVSAGTLSVTTSLFSTNSAPFGGGIRNLGGTLTISTSIFSSNSASSYGGAIYNPGGSLTVTESTFSGNSAGAGGGIMNLGLLTLANSTLFGNSAVIGGGLENTLLNPNVGSAHVTNTTFSGNSASTSGAGISNDGDLVLANTIIANSLSGGDCDSAGTTSGSHTLIEDPAFACGLANSASGNIIGSDPNLGPGTGSPVYLPLNSGSPAINSGDDAICAAAPVNDTSQNGLARPDGAHCDIGSDEADVTPPVVLSIERAGPNPTTAASVSFTVTFSEPVYGVTAGSFVLTASGISGAAVTGVSSDAGAVRTVTVSTGSGRGTLRLDLVDHDTILDTANIYLGGPGQGNGSFSSGAVYDIRSSRTFLAVVRH